jgi:predicted nucleic acid-binding protein
VIVVDASAVVDLVVHEPPDPALTARLRDDADLHAPHLLDVEVTHALRRLVATGALSSDRASDARLDAADLLILRYPHAALLERAWELRDNLSVYDGVYVALAELLEAPLVTCDARLADAPGHHAEIELYPPAG